MKPIALIGGTGLTGIKGLRSIETRCIATDFGAPSTDFVIGEFHNRPIIFLARHGNPHTIPPHKINYRANIQGLRNLGIEQIIAVAAVGGITSEMSPGRIIIPNQIIDYTHDRDHTFYEAEDQTVTHIDFTHPYCEKLRLDLIAAAATAQLNIVTHGVYGATQGPRLETAAEIDRMGKDGCDLVGMTGMPEAALARELDMEYAACAVVANWAAGRSADTITMQDIEKNLDVGLQAMDKLLNHFFNTTEPDC